MIELDINVNEIHKYFPYRTFKRETDGGRWLFSVECLPSNAWGQLRRDLAKDMRHEQDNHEAYHVTVGHVYDKTDNTELILEFSDFRCHVFLVHKSA